MANESIRFTSEDNRAFPDTVALRGEAIGGSHYQRRAYNLHSIS